MAGFCHAGAVKTFLLAALAACFVAQSPAPFPPGATAEQKKAIIRQRMIGAQSEASRAEAVRREAVARIHETNSDRELRERLARVPVVSVKTVETDLRSYIGKTVAVEGSLDVSDYYNFGFRGLSSVCYSFRFSDETGSGYLYQTRTKDDGTRAKILAKNGPVVGKFFIQIPANIEHSEGEGIMALLLKVASAE